MSFLLGSLPGVSADFKDYVEAATDTAKQAFTAPKTIPGERLGLWYGLKTLFVRHPPSEFKYEGLAILAFAIYFIAYIIGRRQNEAYVKRSFGILHRQLHDNFTLIGTKSGASALVKNNDEEFSSTVSGRDNVHRGDIIIQAIPRQDIVVGYLTRAIYGMYFDQEPMADRLLIDFILPAKFDGFVLGLVHKNVMRFQRIDKWDLQFTKTNDAPFSNSFVIMSEAPEVTDKIFTKEFILVAQDLGDALEYLVITDQPRRQPKSAEMVKDRRRVRLSVLLGKSTANEANLNSFLAVVLSMIDCLPKVGTLSLNASKKLQSSREETYQLIGKQVASEEAEDAPKRLTRKEIRDKEAKERLNKLPAKEQKKQLEKEREKAMRKGQKSMTRKA